MRTFTRCTPRSTRPTVWRVAIHILLGAVLGLALAGIFGTALMFLWNYVMPELFHLPVIRFWQAVALLVLARLLTGRIGHGRHRRHWFGGHRSMRGAPSQEDYRRWWQGRNEPPAAPQA